MFNHMEGRMLRWRGTSSVAREKRNFRFPPGKIAFPYSLGIQFLRRNCLSGVCFSPSSTDRRLTHALNDIGHPDGSLEGSNHFSTKSCLKCPRDERFATFKNSFKTFKIITSVVYDLIDECANTYRRCFVEKHRLCWIYCRKWYMCFLENIRITKIKFKTKKTAGKKSLQKKVHARTK